MTQRKRSAKAKRKRGQRESRATGKRIVLRGVVPGQEFERAAADVGREAGKSLLRGLERLFGARFAGWFAGNEAKAKAARMAIETTASIGRARALTDERRRLELEEIQHDEAKALAQRRLNRMLIEMAREEANFEAIAARSLKQIEHDPDGDKTREIDDDWLFKFARYAQTVSDSEIQELWARILASEAIEGRKGVSAAALQTMSLLDKKTAKDFENFCRAYIAFGFYPAHRRCFQYESQDINLRALRELGLIEESTARGYSFPEFDMKLGAEPALDLLHTHMGMTQRGAELANALFQQTDMCLGDELEMKYLKDVIFVQLEEYPINIFPKINGKPVAYMIKVTQRISSVPDVEAALSQYENLPDQLRQLVEWAGENYLISRAPNPAQ